MTDVLFIYRRPVTVIDTSRIMPNLGVPVEEGLTDDFGVFLTDADGTILTDGS
jgi:hypothetical protein